MTNHPNRSKARDWPAFLLAFRVKRNLSQAQLADLLMEPKRAIENWEQGIGRPRNSLKLALERVEQKLD